MTTVCSVRKRMSVVLRGTTWARDSPDRKKENRSKACGRREKMEIQAGPVRACMESSGIMLMRGRINHAEALGEKESIGAKKRWETTDTKTDLVLVIVDLG